MTAETPATVSEQAARLYRQNLTIDQVAAEIGRTSYATRKLLVEAGVTIRQGRPLQANETQRRWNSSGFGPPGHKPPKLTPAQRDEIRRRRDDGETLRVLAAEYGVSIATIHYYS
ncbi:hypothetical protein [Streptomyces sp. NPDC020298]|uniref:hypothetical protein n=1 Tax=unclassified Streptomyces TaxID=2593676 RepID=UPI0034056BB5